MWKRLSEATAKMPITHIVKCPKCGKLMLTKHSQKTKTCPYCNNKVSLLRAQKIATANSAFEASEMLRKLKNKQGFS
jgi:acetyl-CoA carboxylase beta subunit